MRRCVVLRRGCVGVVLCADDVFLRRVFCCCFALYAVQGVAVSWGLMRVGVGIGGYVDVDMYNSASGTWSTAQLSVGRWDLAATSVGNVAIFAGGIHIAGSHVLELTSANEACLSRVFCCCFVVYAVQEVAA